MVVFTPSALKRAEAVLVREQQTVLLNLSACHPISPSAPPILSVEVCTPSMGNSSGWVKTFCCFPASVRLQWLRR